MNSDRLREVLEALAKGDQTVESALEALRGPHIEDMGFARVDLHRSVRCGFPEVVFCEGKTPEQCRRIARVLYEKCGRVLATRADDTVRAELAAEFEGCDFEENAVARAVLVGGTHERETMGEIAVVSAGTGDIPVAEEAAFTARAMGSPVKTLYDVGVAGIHRLLDAREDIQRANVVIVVAGMEGALASVVGGLVDRPVIGVPTSIGYGASFGGAAALLAMLNSCAAGVSVVNIDNGFGAGYVAALINNEAQGGRGGAA
ncbi:MAG: nickel pincer cofactor biosynthesis protein LarB [Planctomycetota bacterium]|jgi:NCAIR mutase (PurE)-related protein